MHLGVVAVLLGGWAVFMTKVVGMPVGFAVFGIGLAGVALLVRIGIHKVHESIPEVLWMVAAVVVAGALLFYLASHSEPPADPDAKPVPEELWDRARR